MSKKSPFPDIGLVKMKILSVENDHVKVETGGKIDLYAFGHLGKDVQERIIKNSEIIALPATRQQRNLLGILSDKAIQDIVDDSPHACPITIKLIENYAQNPFQSICFYLETALCKTGITGAEPSVNKRIITYRSSSGILTAHMRFENWELNHSLLKCYHPIPETLSSYAIGKELKTVFNNKILDVENAFIRDIVNKNGHVEVVFETIPINIKENIKSGILLFSK